jgi:tetratricopeptide (TPR) repeat protein/DNA-binding CsgD family transcriptional regulator
MIKQLVCLLLFIVLYTHSFAQNNTNRKLDSLTALVPSATQDTNKVLLLAAISQEYFQTDPDKSKAYGQQVLELATSLKYNYGIIKGHNLMARCYGIQNNFPEALNHYQAALAKAQELNNPKMIAILSVSLGAIYTGNNEFDKAYQYLMDAKEAFAKAGITNTVSLFTNLGVLFAKQDKYAEALQYYEQGITQQEATGAITPDLATLYANAGGMHLALHDYNQALRDLFKALAIQQNLNNTKSIGFIYSNIGNAYRRAAALNNMASLPDSLRNKSTLLNKAKYFIQQSLAITEDMGIRDISLENYSGLSDVYSMLGNDKEAYNYLNKYTLLKDSLRDIKQEKEFARIEAEFNVKKTTDSLKYLNASKDDEARQRKLERNSMVSAITLIGIITALLINRQKLKQVQKRKIAEAEKNKAEEYAHAQLEDFKQRIQEKNQLIETITAEIGKYKEQNGAAHTALDYSLLKELEQAILLTDGQWDAFKNTFDKVHIGYIIRLKEKIADISPAETRFILLTKLKLSNKEMAGMLGVTPQAMRTNKYRLMKKLGIDDDEVLEHLIQTI